MAPAKNAQNFLKISRAGSCTFAKACELKECGSFVNAVGKLGRVTQSTNLVKPCDNEKRVPTLKGSCLTAATKVMS